MVHSEDVEPATRIERANCGLRNLSDSFTAGSGGLKHAGMAFKGHS